MTPSCRTNLALLHMLTRSLNNTTQTDLKGLSGGERSFSTLAFTLALENVISVPFCCLDEFDVVGLWLCRCTSYQSAGCLP